MKELPKLRVAVHILSGGEHEYIALIAEKGVDSRTGVARVEVDANFYRPLDVEQLTGDSAKAKRMLGWEAQTTFKQLVQIMVEEDFSSMSQQSNNLRW